MINLRKLLWNDKTFRTIVRRPNKNTLLHLRQRKVMLLQKRYMKIVKYKDSKYDEVPRIQHKILQQADKISCQEVKDTDVVFFSSYKGKRAHMHCGVCMEDNENYMIFSLTTSNRPEYNNIPLLKSNGEYVYTPGGQVQYIRPEVDIIPKDVFENIPKMDIPTRKFLMSPDLQEFEKGEDYIFSFQDAISNYLKNDPQVCSNDLKNISIYMNGK